MVTVNIQSMKKISVNDYLADGKEDSFITLDITCDEGRASIFILEKQELDMLKKAIKEAEELW